MVKKLDQIDRNILNMLQKNARMPIKEIAEQVFLSSPAITMRIQHLEQNGYIEGYHAAINFEQVGMNIKAFVKMALNTRHRPEFLSYIETCSNVIACYTITGDYAILLETMFPSMRQLDAFIQKLQKFGETHTDIVFLTSFEKRQMMLPIEDD